MLLEKYANKFDVQEEQITPLIEWLLDCAKNGMSQADVLKEFND